MFKTSQTSRVLRAVANLQVLAICKVGPPRCNADHEPAVSMWAAVIPHARSTGLLTYFSCIHVECLVLECIA